MVEVDVYEIDGKDYLLINTIKAYGETYLYLSNESTEDDFIIRKVDKTNPEYIIPLDSEEEAKKAALIFVNKQLED